MSYLVLGLPRQPSAEQMSYLVLGLPRQPSPEQMSYLVLGLPRQPSAEQMSYLVLGLPRQQSAEQAALHRRPLPMAAHRSAATTTQKARSASTLVWPCATPTSSMR